MSDGPQFNYATAEIVGERLGKIFEGLNKEQAMAAMEELIDDYTHGVFGLSVVDTLRRVKMADGGRCQTIQPLAQGRAVLVSAYGFNVKTDTKCKCGRAFIVLDEKNREDHNKDMDSLG